MHARNLAEFCHTLQTVVFFILPQFVFPLSWFPANLKSFDFRICWTIQGAPVNTMKSFHKANHTVLLFKYIMYVNIIMMTNIFPRGLVRRSINFIFYCYFYAFLNYFFHTLCRLKVLDCLQRRHFAGCILTRSNPTDIASICRTCILSCLSRS